MVPITKEPSSPKATDLIVVEPEDSLSPLKHPVQRPPKSFDQLEKEYVANLEALINMDEADWLEAVNLLEMAHTEEVLSQDSAR